MNDQIRVEFESFDVVYWNGATICSCGRSILVLTNEKCDLRLQEHRIVDKLLHLDYVQSFGHA